MLLHVLYMHMYMCMYRLRLGCPDLGIPSEIT